MKDKKLVVVLVVIIVLLLIGGAYLLGVKQNIKNFPEGCGFNGELCVKNQNIQNPIAWTKSKEFGVYYPMNWVVKESWYLPESLKGYSEKEGTPEFSITNGNAIISWGGNMSGCKENQFGIFEPGVSVITCLRGMKTNIGLENVRNKISNEELNIFGDFVLRNQDKIISQQEAENLVHMIWSDCSKGDCGGVKVTVSKNNTVTAVYTELDDSVAFSKREANANYQDGVWVLGTPTITNSCHLNRGHQDFSNVPCI